MLRELRVHLAQLPVLHKILLVLLCVAALVSVFQGWQNAQIYSNDFQWSPAVLFSEGINPYRYYLEGNFDKRIFGSQAPNYAHATYVILSPLTLFEWENAKLLWAFFNIVISIWIVLKLAKEAQLSVLDTVVVLLFFLCSTPFRNSVGNGQQSLLILFAAAFVLQRSNYAYAIAGISYLKYSFSPPLAGYIVLRHGWKALAWSLTVPLVGFVVFWSLQADKSLFTLLLQPLAVNALSVGVGLSDYMTIISLLFDEKSGWIWNIFYYLFTVLFSVLITIWSVRGRENALLGFAMVSVICLLFYKHLIYDYVFLLPAFVAFYKYRNFWYAKLAVVAILYFWFGVRVAVYLSQIFPVLEEYLLFSRVFNFAVLSTILVMLWLVREKKDRV